VAKKRTGIYLTTQQILDNPDYVRVLRDRIGLDLAILGFSGEAAPRVLAQSPFDGVPLSDACLHSLVVRHLDGGPVDPREFDWARQSVGPALRAGGSDAQFRRAVDSLRRTGVEIWIGAGAWTERRLMFCPSHPGVNGWFEALYVDLATRYGADGLDITHARYPMCSFPRGLFSCTCARCAAAAAALGYDLEEMKDALRAGLDRLRTVDTRLLGQVCRLGAGPFDFLQLLGIRPGVVDWFRFRAELLKQNLRRFHRAVHQAAGPGFVFGTDTHPASLSLFVGHHHPDWAEFSDFASPLVSHISAFVCDTFAVWARFLQQLKPGLEETDALQGVYRFAGYDGMGLPDTIAGFDPEHPARLACLIPLEALVMRDLLKARLYLPAGLPSYPIIHGTGWPRPAIEAIVRGAADAGHDGIIWQGTDELVDFRPR
jgi:hypothetical protein